MRGPGLRSAALAALIFWAFTLTDHVVFGPLPLGRATVGVAGLGAAGALVVLLVSAVPLAFLHARLEAWLEARSRLVFRSAAATLGALVAFTLGCFVVYLASPRLPVSTTNVVASLSTLPVAAALGLVVFRSLARHAMKARAPALLCLGYAGLGLGVSGWVYPYNTSYEWAHSLALSWLALAAIATAVALVARRPAPGVHAGLAAPAVLLLLGALTLELVLECREGYARWDVAIRGGRIARAIARNTRVLWKPPTLALLPLVKRANPAKSRAFAPPQRVSKELGPALVATRPTGVLLLTVDAARADFGATGRSLPTFERLAREGITFTAHHTAAGSTRPAIRTLFMGTWPWNIERHATPNLFRIFRDGGFRTLVVLPNKYPLEGNEWLKDGVDELVVDSKPAMPRGPVADQTTDALIQRLGRVGSAPYFAWAHYIDPHEPYDAEGRNDRERYVGELARVDHEIDRLLATLEAKGLLARTLVVVSADHGEEFFEHGGENHGLAVYEESIHVPLVIRAPGGSVRGRVDTPSSSLELGATLLAVAGVRPAGAFGSSPETLLELNPNQTVFAVNQGLRDLMAPATTFAALRGRYKLVFSPYYESAELYDLEGDPHETKNLVDQRPELASALAKELAKELRKSGLKPN